jgi:hypothetical protein
MNKKKINIIILLIFAVVTVYLVFSSGEMAELPVLLEQTKRGYLILAILLMGAYLVLNACIIELIGRSISPSFNFKNAFFLSLVGQYYSLITPFASGGQPAQVYLMKTKYNVSYAKGTALTIKKFIVFQVSVTLYAIILFSLKFNLIFAKQLHIITFIIIGLLINVVGSILILILFYNHKIIKKITKGLLNFITAFSWFKKINKEKIYESIDDYASNIDEMKNNKRMMVKLIVLTLIQLTFYFSITYFIYLALGYNEAHYTDILAIQTVLYVVVSFIPTPGGAGASESGFYVLFSIFFTKDVLLYAMLLWRLIVYYGVLIISGCVVLIDSILNKTKIKI